MPEYLYHYTQADTLGLILETRRIRFNRLDHVRDLTEGQSRDLGRLGMYQFVSCWTESVAESIPVWGLYTPQMAGVRVRLPIDMFAAYEQESTRYKGVHVDPGTRHILPLDERIRGNCIVGPHPPEFPHRMMYTDNPNLLTPSVAEEPTVIQFGRIGVYKSHDWEFEAEWRYRLFAVPHPVPRDGDFGSPRFAETVGRQIVDIFNARTVEDTGLFGTLSDSAFRQMELLLGPCLDTTTRTRIESLLARLNPDCRVKSSRFAGRIRCD